MKTSTIMYLLIVIVIILGAWYLLSSTGQPLVTQPVIQPIEQQPVVSSTSVGINGSPDQTNTGEKSVSPVIKVSSDAKLGQYLVASNDMTLYTFTKDTANTSNCSGACVAIWPQYSPTTNEPLVTTSDIKGQLSTITRTDGSLQLTYKGLPLYFFKNDIKPGDVLGQNFNKLWFVVKP
jgi:predicted lipoprotein with Yx(FWY)xxD motif